jgi:hypothetical protein
MRQDQLMEILQLRGLDSQRETSSTIVPGCLRKKSVCEFGGKSAQSVWQVAHKNKSRVPSKQSAATETRLRQDNGLNYRKGVTSYPVCAASGRKWGVPWWAQSLAPSRIALMMGHWRGLAPRAGIGCGA